MKTHTLYSRAHYVLLHGVVERFFDKRPHLDFLRDSQNELKLFQRYISWSEDARDWTHTQQTILYNLYWRQRSDKKRAIPSPQEESVACWASLLKYYLYTPYNPASLVTFIKNQPYLSFAKKNFYTGISSDRNILPSFQEVLIALSPMELLKKTILQSSPNKALLFSSQQRRYDHQKLDSQNYLGLPILRESELMESFSQGISHPQVHSMPILSKNTAQMF